MTPKRGFLAEMRVGDKQRVERRAERAAEGEQLELITKESHID